MATRWNVGISKIERHWELVRNGTVELEVRCCCGPENLLGYLEVPLFVESPMGLAVLKEDGLAVVIGIEGYGSEDGPTRLAVNSDGYSIDWWQGVCGFRQARTSEALKNLNAGKKTWKKTWKKAKGARA